MAHAETTGTGRNFYVHVAGKTNGAHQAFVEKLKDGGHFEVQSPGDSDYLLVFCPIASRVGTDISEALDHLPGGKPAVLVVMHHTFKPDRVVAPSRRQVDNANVLLTVDCLFYEHKLLECNCNEIAWYDIQKFLGIPLSQGHTMQEFKNHLKLMPGRNFYVHVEGETNGAHHTFVEKLKDGGHFEVQSPGDSDYLLVFCPIASRVGTDIHEALLHIPGGKPAVLVVMHHTFNPDHVVAPSRRLVDNPNVLLTVDCLFYEHKLLKCNCNEIAWRDIQKFLGIPLSQVHTMQGFKKHLHKLRVGCSWICIACGVVSAAVILLVFLSSFYHLPWKGLSTQGDTRLTGDMAHAETTGTGRNFYVHLAEKNNGAHQAFVEKLKDGGHIEVQSPGDSDYLLVFCPIASRVGTDIHEALLHIPGGKPAVLVVMHHTFSPDHVVAPSRRQVDNPNVLLTEHSLFNERKLLECNRNENAWYNVQKCLGIPLSQGHTMQGNKKQFKKLRKLPGRNFYVHLAGQTNGAHQAFVEKLKDGGHFEVQSPGDSDYLLVFCPIASRVETDIHEALLHIPGGKPAILVVMHHTFNPDHVVAPSRRQVDNLNVLLTVDSLFYEHKLLECNRNEIAWYDIQKFLRIPLSQVYTMQGFINHLKLRTGRNFYVHVAGQTNGAHQAFVEKLKDGGHFEVQSPGDSDYLLVFCPISSRVETDIHEALLHIPGGKPAVLVVMHHTFSPDHVVAPSRRQVDNPNVLLTVDYLFYEYKLLECNCNEIAWYNVFLTGFIFGGMGIIVSAIYLGMIKK